MSTRKTDPLILAADHLSFFQKDAALYCYHDLIGYVLMMSRDIHELMTFFTIPRQPKEAEARFPSLPADMIEELLETLTAHRCLLDPHEDPLEWTPNMVPVKSKWRVAYTDSKGQVTLVLSRTPGEAPRYRDLDPMESLLWGMVDGERTLSVLSEEVASTLNLSLDEALKQTIPTMASWTHHSAQVMKLSEVPLSFYKELRHAQPPYLISTLPFDPMESAGGDTSLRPPKEATSAAVVDLRAYHQRDIVDPNLQFDEVETTLNHLFRLPHRALGGDTYPGRMLRILLDRGVLHKPGSTIVEVGGGTGSFARGFLDALQHQRPELMEGLSYRIVEISPALAASQAHQLEPYSRLAETTLGDAEALTLPDHSVDLLIANEMIGDLRTAWIHQSDLDPDSQREWEQDEVRDQDHGEGLSSQEAMEVIQKYQLLVADAPECFALNLGAIRLLEGTARVLKPGGWAVITEYGEEFIYPKVLDHLDHAEHSIHFGHLMHVARQIHLQTEYHFLMDWLDMDLTLTTLATTRTYLRNLQALFARHGRSLPKAALTRKDLAALAESVLDLDRVEALHFQPIQDRVCGLVPHQFKALLCQRIKSDGTPS